MTYKRIVSTLVMAGIIIIASISSLSAQPPPNPDDVADTPVPITGVEYLLLSGGILGSYKMLKNRFKGSSR